MNRVLRTYLPVVFLISSLLSFTAESAVLKFTQPNPQLTPGKICTPFDPNFSRYRYPAQIPYCNRNVTLEEKQKVAAAYGISDSDWSQYEFDHLIPLSAGGSDDFENIWPQPISEAREKDKVELDIYNNLNSGAIGQDQAIQEIKGWFATSSP